MSADGVRFVLGSGSAIRRAVLEQAGLRFSVLRPDVDEGALKASMAGASGEELAVALAEAKALDVSRRCEDLVLGADQILAFDGALLDKARDMAEARARLQAMRGKTHRLIGGYALARTGTLVWRHVTITELTMRPFSDTFLDWYLESAGEAVLASVGCYQFETEGVQLFESVRGDYFSILGLDLLSVLPALRDHGGAAS